jgi:hypothetical protein
LNRHIPGVCRPPKPSVTVAPASGESETESETMRGGGLIFPREGHPAEVQGIRSEAAEGIRTLDLLHGNYAGLRKPRRECSGLQGFLPAATDSLDQQYAGICADMQRSGHFRAEVPEIRDGGLITPSPRVSRWGPARTSRTPMGRIEINPISLDGDPPRRVDRPACMLS